MPHKEACITYLLSYLLLSCLQNVGPRDKKAREGMFANIFLEREEFSKWTANLHWSCIWDFYCIQLNAIEFFWIDVDTKYAWIHHTGRARYGVLSRLLTLSLSLSLSLASPSKEEEELIVQLMEGSPRCLINCQGWLIWTVKPTIGSERWTFINGLFLGNSAG